MTEANVAGASEATARAAPVVIYAPPPSPSRVDLKLLWPFLRAGGLTMAFVLLAVVCLVPRAELRSVLELLLMSLGAIGVPAFVSFGFLMAGSALAAKYPRLRRLTQSGRMLAERRRRYDQEHPGWAADRLLVALGNVGSGPSGSLDIAGVAKALRAHGSDRQSAHIVCYGPVFVPEVGELRFEPSIITPRQAQCVQLLLTAVVVTLLLIMVWLISGTYHHTVPSLLGRGGLRLLTTGIGVIVTVVWIWGTCVRPTYVRLAPGMIQILEYRRLGSKPRIRSYPMESGTVVVVQGALGGRMVNSVQLARGEWSDCLMICLMSRPGEALQQIWQALLSTAPTPPLSEEGLVG